MIEKLEERLSDFDTLHDKVNAVLKGHDVDNIIPVLACMITHAGYLSGSSAEMLKKFMIQTIDDYYTDQGPQIESAYEH